ncbi:MAG: CDP-alcohol phosphatidyltransferase family protein [Pleurocapsa sp. MO_192.B19]|nr:CDP-alcohol phosphatidyltransferase family protein [Pleurocapsa sp. MO_192.B19]
MPSPILRQLDFPNIFTLTGLIISLLSAIFAIQGNFYLAAICLIYAGLTDMLDGVVARSMQRTQLQSEVGKQLDSIVDVCSFGFAPAIFAYCFGLQDIFSITLLIFYVAIN